MRAYACMADTAREVRRKVAAAWKALSNLTPWQWAEQNIVLPPSLSPAAPGPVDTGLIPYCRRWLEQFANRRTRRMVLCTGTQAGKTITIQLGVAWRIVHRAGNVIWTMPDRQLVTDFSKNRWQVLIMENPVLAALMPSSRRYFTNLAQKLGMSMLWFAWAGSASQLSSRSADLLIGDELDKFPDAGKKETSARFLLIERAKTLANPLIVFTSTPTSEQGDIWQEFLQGTQEYYWVQCPHCKERIKLEFTEETVKWDSGARDENGDWDMARVKKTAHYLPPCCKRPIVDDQKPAMLRSGEWRVSNAKADPDNPSYHLESIYSPWPSCTFGALAITFLTLKRQPGGMHNFNNAYRARPYRVNVRLTKGSEIDAIVKHSPEYVLTLEDNLPSTVIPKKPLVIWMAVDVSSREYDYVVRAFLPDESSYLLACGQAGSWDEVMKIASVKYRIEGSKNRMNVGAIFVDSGFEAKKSIYDICAKYYRKVWPMKGGKHAVPVGTKEVDWGHNPEDKKRLELTHYDDSTFKEHLYIDKIQRREMPGWFLPKNIPPQYKDHFGAEHIEEVDGVLKWIRTGANHLADTEKLLLVALAKYRHVFASYRRKMRAERAERVAQAKAKAAPAATQR